MESKEDPRPQSQPRSSQHRHRSPLRYPGGKAALVPFVKKIIIANNLIGGEYIEPYAGGAAVAIELLASDFVTKIHINDYNPGVHAFWHAILNQTDELLRLIQDTPVTLETRAAVKAVYLESKNPENLELGFATFFLNRVNRSGVITGGVIGGLAQTGDYLMHCRYNKPDLIKIIEFIARYRNRIRLTNLDALDLISSLSPDLNPKHLLYLDPPYFHKGSQLYSSYYRAVDHAVIADKLRSLNKIKWMVSYDGCSEIEELFSGLKRLDYNLAYTANGSSTGRELMFFSSLLDVPHLAESKRVSPLTSHTQLTLPLS